MDFEKDLWTSIFKYSEYVKGATYSASDIIGDLLSVRLRKENPNHDDMAVEDKVAAWIGSACHNHCEAWLKAENAFGETNMQSEVRLKFKNISGTCDLLIDNHIILDYKTSTETNMKKSINALKKNHKDTQWCKQLSIYTYLNHKSNKQPYGKYGYIAWLCVDTKKYGVEKVELLPKSETIALIKSFLVEIEKPIEEMKQCHLCVQFKSRWCGVRKICPKWNEDREDFSNVECW